MKHDVAIPQPPKGWIKATPLENCSSLNELSLLGLMGLNVKWPKKHFLVQFNFNLHSPLKIHPHAYLTFDTKDNGSNQKGSTYCFSITGLNRWNLDISSYQTIDDFLSASIRWHRCNYSKSEKIFNNYGCKITFIEGDWSEHVEQVYKLYANVADRHGDWLYDLHFFQAAAKRDDFKLICAWFESKMIAVSVLQEELPTLHSICCGMDYHHSSSCYAYSWMSYALIKEAIDLQKYQNVNVGLTADESKKAIGFEPVSCHMDIYSKSAITRGVLKVFSKFVTATIKADAKLKFSLKLP